MKNVERIIKLHKEGKVDDTTLVKMAVFKEKVVELIKEAGGLDPKHILWAAAITAGAGLAGAAAETASDYFMSRRAKKDMEERTGQIFEEIYASPELKAFPKETAEKYFNTLKHFSPHIASDPLAAKTYLLQMLKWSDDFSAPIATTTVRDLTEIENKAMGAMEKRPGFGVDIGRFMDPLVESVQKAPKNLYTAYRDIPDND